MYSGRRVKAYTQHHFSLYIRMFQCMETPCTLQKRRCVYSCNPGTLHTAVNPYQFYFPLQRVLCVGWHVQDTCVRTLDCWHLHGYTDTRHFQCAHCTHAATHRLCVRTYVVQWPYTLAHVRTYLSVQPFMHTVQVC